MVNPDVWAQIDRMRQTLTGNTHISREALERMLDQHKLVVAERDALKAHCGRLRAALLAATTNAIRVAENMERSADIGPDDLFRQPLLDIHDIAVGALREYPTLSLAREKAESPQKAIDRLEAHLGAIRAAWAACDEWPDTYSDIAALREAIAGAGKEAEGRSESD